MSQPGPIYKSLTSLFPQAKLPTSLLYFSSSTPFSTLPSISIALLTYFAVIFSGRFLLRDSNPIPSGHPLLKWPFLVHNLLLSFSSALLLALILEEILPIWSRNGSWYAVCGEGAWTARLETFYIINYMFKFWELLDTVFLVLKKKPLAFLHVYHHSATALLCFSQLHGRTSVSWVVITLNLAVHVIMYLYYALTSLKIQCPWKRYVTVCQVIQFIIDLAVVYTVTSAYYLNKWGKIKGYDCAGKEYAAISGVTVLSSYLVLFILFYRKTYSDKKVKRAQREKSQLKSSTNGVSITHGNGKGNGKANGKH